MPVVIHDRKAHADGLEIVKQFSHRFPEPSTAIREARKCERASGARWYLGFTGVVTFKNARKTLETLEICPLDKILIETDCPYLSPEPNRGKRNDSSNLEFVVRRIAEIKGLSEERVAEITMANGKRLYGIE
jgi:TatD DNase family protein